MTYLVDSNIKTQEYYKKCDWCFNKYDVNKSYKHCLSCIEKIDMFVHSTYPNGYHFDGYYLYATYIPKKSTTDKMPKIINFRFQVPKWMDKEDFVNDIYCGSQYIFNLAFYLPTISDQYEFYQAKLCKQVKSISDEMFGTND